MNQTEAERHKYTRMWERDSYRERSPGARVLEEGLRLLGSPRSGASFFDFGCGTGRVAKALQDRGYRVSAVDIAANACKEFDGPFYEACLWELGADVPMADYGYCADVLEHLPPNKVLKSIQQMLAHCRRGAFFQAALFHCHEGDAIGETLHLTVRPSAWWEATFARTGHRFTFIALPKYVQAVVTK